MNKIREYIKKTKKYLKKYDYDKVIESCDKILEIKEDSTFGLRFKGIAYFQTGRYKEGLNCYKKLYKLTRDNDTIYTIAYLNEQLGNYEEALKFYNITHTTDKIRSKRKRLLTKMEDYPTIIDHYDKKLNELKKLSNTIDHTKRKIIFLEEKGVFNYRNKEYDEAYTVFMEASRLYQTIEDKLSIYEKEKNENWYTMLREYVTEYPVAEDFFKEFFNFEGNLKAWHDKITYRFSQYEDSLIYTDLILEQCPDNTYLLELCASHSKCIDDDYSLDCWNRILEIEPENTKAINEILDIYSYHFSKDKSLKLINEKLYIPEISADLLERKIRLLESMTLYDEAIRTYDDYLCIIEGQEQDNNAFTVFDKLRCMEEKALELYMDGKLCESYNLLKEVYMLFKNTSKDYEKISPSEWYLEAWYTKVLCESIQKSDDNPTRFFKEFYLINDKTIKLWIRKIKFLIDWKHFGNPITYCNILIEKNATNTSLLLTKAYVYYRTKRLQKALDAYNNVLRHDPDNNRAKNYKFNILVQQEEYIEAYNILKLMNIEYSIINTCLEKLAEELLEEKEYKEALYCYENLFNLTNRTTYINKIKFLLLVTDNKKRLEDCPYYDSWINIIMGKLEEGKCPICGKKLIPVIYGLVSSELLDDDKIGEEYLLGGCCVSIDSPTHYCKHCKKYVHMGTFQIEISCEDTQLSSYARQNINWLTNYLKEHPNALKNEIEVEAKKKGIDHHEITSFLKKLEEIEHIKIRENTIQLNLKE